jgi:hypothetical protein
VEQPQAYGEGHKVNEKKSSRETLIGVALLVGLVLIAVFLLVTAGVRWYLSPDNQLSIVQRRDLVQGLASAGQALAVALTGAVGLGGLFFTWRNTNQVRESTQRTLELIEQGQITERFTKAIEQLGTLSNEGKNLEMRLGGIHALERISRESEYDYWPIMEILSAYVREHAPRDPAAEHDIDAEVKYRHADTAIQAILDVIGQRSRKWPTEENLRIRLEETDLREAAFVNANLTRVWFHNSDLRNAYFMGGDLHEAIFTKADLRGAIFHGVFYLDRTGFVDANLENTLFDNVNLQRAVGLTQQQIEQARGINTTLPDSLSKPVHWEDSDPS